MKMIQRHNLKIFKNRTLYWRASFFWQSLNGKHGLDLSRFIRTKSSIWDGIARATRTQEMVIWRLLFELTLQFQQISFHLIQNSCSVGKYPFLDSKPYAVHEINSTSTIRPSDATDQVIQSKVTKYLDIEYRWPEISMRFSSTTAMDPQHPT